MRGYPSGSFYWMAVMAAIIVLMLFAAQTLPTEVRVTPVLLGYVTLGFFAILMGLEFVRAIQGQPYSGTQPTGPDSQTDRGDVPEDDAEQPWPSVLRIMTYIVAFWLLVVLFGLVLIPPVFIIFFLVIEARVRLLYAVGAALVLCAALITGLLLLKVEVWLGVIAEVIPGILGGSILPEL